MACTIRETTPPSACPPSPRETDSFRSLAPEGERAAVRAEGRSPEARAEWIRGRLGCSTGAHEYSLEDDVGVGEVVVELDAREALEGRDVASACARDYGVGQLGAGVGLVPARLLAEVAHELLVEGRLRPAGRVAVGGPEARGVGRQRLVGEHESSPPVEAELELGVGDDDAALASVVRGETVELDGQALHLREPVGAHQLSGLLARDVLVMAGRRLGGRSEDRRGETLRLAQSW